MVDLRTFVEKVSIRVVDLQAGSDDLLLEEGSEPREGELCRV